MDPGTGTLLGNTPLVWSHAELARCLYVLDAAQRRASRGALGLWVWRPQRYVRLRHRQRRGAVHDADLPDTDLHDDPTRRTP